MVVAFSSTALQEEIIFVVQVVEHLAAAAADHMKNAAKSNETFCTAALFILAAAICGQFVTFTK